jgi:hypothetical protein
MILERVSALLASHGHIPARRRAARRPGGTDRQVPPLPGKGWALLHAALPERQQGIASAAKLKAAVGVKTRMARHEETVAATGFEPGGVCPFGIDGSIRILIDESLAQYRTIYPAAGTSASGVPITFAQPLSITGGQAGDFSMAEETGTDRQPEEGTRESQWSA